MAHRGRTTTDRKGESIRIRLNEEMRIFIERKAHSTGTTISEVFRDYISVDMVQHKY